MLDIPGRCWSDEVLSKLGIEKQWLAEVYESQEVSGHVSQEAAALTGLKPGTPVVGGGGDQAAGAVGNGIVKPGVVSSTIGTSGVKKHRTLRQRAGCFVHADGAHVSPHFHRSQRKIVVEHHMGAAVTERMRDDGYVVNTPQKDIIMYLKGYTPQGFSGQCAHIHVRYYGDWDELYFRDYLCAHPDIAEEYGMLKLALKEEYTYDRDGYTEAKSEFVNRYTQLARAEFHGRYAP